MLPRVIARNAVSLDGRFGGFEADLRQYYQIVGCWNRSNRKVLSCGSAWPAPVMPMTVNTKGGVGIR